MRALVVWDYQRRHHPIRNCFGVFKNQPLPKKFMFCQNMQERDECSYQNACLFSHSITELAVWKIQKREGIKEHEAVMYRLQEMTRDDKNETDMVLS